MLPIDRHAAPHRLLAELRACRNAPTTTTERLRRLDLQPMTGGLNNHVYLWSSPYGPVCIKIYKVDQRRRTDREWQSLTLLAKHEINRVPIPLWLDPHPDQPAIGMTVLPGTPIPDAGHPDAALKGLADTLNRIHAVPLDGELAELVRIDSADHYIQRITAIWGDQLAAQPNDALTRELMALRERWLNSGDPQMLSAPAPKTFSHGDANLINWLWDSVTTRCVDFEFAGWSDLAFDCADLVEHISARDVADDTWAKLLTTLGITGANMPRYLAAQRTCALRWLAVLWKQRHRRTEEFQTQLERVRRLHRTQATAE